jgi:hypothetical protein
MAKPTNKERDQQLGSLTMQVTNLNRLLGAYIEYKGDAVDFQKYLIDLNEKMKKERENDSSNVIEVDTKEG